MPCAALDWHCSQITRLWFHIPHLHVHAVQRFILQIPWPQEAAIMFLHPDHSPASLSLLNRAFVGCHVGVSVGTCEHLSPGACLPRPSSESPQGHTVWLLQSHTGQDWCVFLLHIGPLARGETNSKTLHTASKVLLSSPTPSFTYDVFSLQSCIFQGGNYSSRTMHFIPSE